MTAQDETVNLFECRFHDVAQGRLGDEIDHMRAAICSTPDGTSCLFEKFGVPRPLAGWTTSVGAELRLVYLMHWPSMDARERCFTPMLESPAWSASDTRDEPDTPRLKSTEAWLLGASRVWVRSGERSAVIGGVHEMRIHRITGGQAQPVADYLAEIEHPQIKVLGGTILGVFDVLFGPDMPAIVTFMAWPDFATQRRATARLHVEPRAAQRLRRWNAEYGETLIRATERTLLRPLEFARPVADFGVQP